jgi:hypothetical protein
MLEGRSHSGQQLRQLEQNNPVVKRLLLVALSRAGHRIIVSCINLNKSRGWSQIKELGNTEL